MNFFTSAWIAKALDLPAPLENKTHRFIASDSREVGSGDLFVALIGENTDGHNFVEKARAQGATALVHLKSFSPPAGILSFPVENTLDAFRKLAKAWRKEFHFPVIAVAGSSGKTSSKELLAALLRGKWNNVLQTQASQNGFQGVPTTLLRMREDQGAAVVEVGIDEPGAMIQHLDLVAPDAGLLTSIGPEHLEKLIDIDTVEKEEGLLFKVLEQRGAKAAVNQDDARIVNQARHLKKCAAIPYGIKNPAYIRGKKLPEDFLEVTGLDGGPHSFKQPMPGIHNALNLLGAIAMANTLGLSADEMQKGLATFTPPPGRSEIHRWKGCRVLVDTYNANPSSVEAAIGTLLDEAAKETWVCLGDMLEMGKLEEELHRNLANLLEGAHINHVLLYGPRMAQLEDELKKRNFPGSVEHFSTHEALASSLRAAKAGDSILIKGSRGMRMEKAWEALQRN